MSYVVCLSNIQSLKLFSNRVSNDIDTEPINFISFFLLFKPFLQQIMVYRVALFDLDGTFIDTEPLSIEEW